MDHTFGDGDTLLRLEFDGATFEIHQEEAFDDVEELVLIVVLVPVELAMQDAKPDDAVVDAGEGLVEPLLLTLGGFASDVYQIEGSELDVEVDRIGLGGQIGSESDRQE